MNDFDKIVAAHLLKQRKDELVETHEERQKELTRLYEELKQENVDLQKASGEMKRKDIILEALRNDINQTRSRITSLAEVKQNWVNILRQKFKEQRCTYIIKVFILF